MARSVGGVGLDVHDGVEPAPEQEQQPEHEHAEAQPEVDVDPGGLLQLGVAGEEPVDRQGDAVDDEQPADHQADVEQLRRGGRGRAGGGGLVVAHRSSSRLR
jgi:hypothetical protein